MFLFFRKTTTGDVNAPSLVAAVVMLLGVSPLPVHGQRSILEHFNPISSNVAGVHLYGLSVSSAYFPDGYGRGGFGVGGPQIGFSGFSGQAADSRTGMAQASAVLGWSVATEKSSASITYSPSYARALHASNYRSLNHSLSGSFGRSLTPKWALTASANGLISDFSQLLFARTQSGTVSATTATFDEFFAAVVTGRSGNTALMQAVNAAPTISSTETGFLYGDRLLSTGASLAVSYAYSSRSSFGMSIGARRTQPFKHGTSTAVSTSEQGFVMPMTTAGSANLTWSYSLTPRTTASVNLSTSRILSRFQDAYNTQTSVSVGRTLTDHWFVTGTLGVGFITPMRSTFTPSQSAQQTFGAGTGYKIYAHTFMVSYSRNISDPYGLGANATEASTGAWTWKRPGAGISLSASSGYSRLISPAFPNSRSWMTQAGVGKSIGSHFATSFGVSYTQYPQALVTAAAPNISRAGIVATLSWSPSVRQ